VLDATINAVVLERPPIEASYEQHRCLDKGDDNEHGWEVCLDHEYVPHIALIHNERPPRPHTHKPRRWVVERTLAWLSKCRDILIRWEKKSANDLGLLKLACARIRFRRYHRLAILRWISSAHAAADVVVGCP
jgi:putative transposase